jgi:glycosyltransferase involved in cell wall biosynthesis
MVKRVVHLTSVHTPFDNRIFGRQCRSLAQFGYDVALVAPHDGGDGIVERVRICAVPRPSDRLGRLSCTVPAVWHRATIENADIYHLHDPELLLLGLYLRRAGKKVIYDVHENYPASIAHSPWVPRLTRGLVSCSFDWFEGYAARRMSALIVANTEIAKRVSCFNPRTVTIGNYPAFSEYPGAPDFNKARYTYGALVSFGGISSRTCTQAVVEALGLLPLDTRATLLLAGTETSPGLLRALTYLPGWKRVNYPGTVSPDSMMKALLNASVAFVLFSPVPNHFGVGSNRFYEALAAGVPVITSDFPNWKQLVDGQGCGIAVDSLDPRAIADAVLYLLSHPGEALAMGQRGYKLATERFNWENESRKLCELYEQLLQNRGCDAVSQQAPDTEARATRLAEY